MRRSPASACSRTRFLPLRPGGEWNLVDSIVVGSIALVALAFSVYVVYLLEIVKLMNPRVRRRERELAEARERLSA